MKPTVGRVVHYRDSWSHNLDPKEQPNAALIVYVFDDRTVNLVVYDRSGCARAEKSVPLADGPCETRHWAWMEYQKGQAAREEELERKLEERERGG